MESRVETTERQKVLRDQCDGPTKRKDDVPEQWATRRTIVRDGGKLRGTPV